jgi:hypothetical protein
MIIWTHTIAGNECNCDDMLSLRNKILNEAEQTQNHNMARKLGVCEHCIWYKTAVTSGLFISKENNFQQ